MRPLLFDDYQWLIDDTCEYYWYVRWFRNTKGEILYFSWNQECGGL